MSILISDDVLSATRMTEAEMKQEIAVLLFQKEKMVLDSGSREEFWQDLQNMRDKKVT